jgi:hypothetical protein
MSASWSAVLVVGVPAAEVAENHTDFDAVTRYNEVTGEPYEKKIDKPTVSIGNLVFEGTFEEQIRYEGEEMDAALRGIGLGFFRPHHEYDPWSAVLGVKVVEAHGEEYGVHTMLTSVDDVELNTAMQGCTVALKQLGYEHLRPAVWVIQQVNW